MITVTTDMPDNKTVVHWQVSRFCEKSCHYCTAYDFMQTIKKDKAVLHHPKDKIELDDHIATLLPQVVTNGNILLFGGEPTLHPRGIDYFNSLCYNTKENPDVAIFLVTHGDIDLDKIDNIETHNKQEHIVSISYHYYQVEFNEWIKKVKRFNKKSNVLVSAIIPRSEKVWKQFENNILELFAEGISVDVKSELDNKTNLPDPKGFKHFKDLYEIGRKTQNEIMKKLDTRTLYISDGNNIETVYATESALPLKPKFTFCNTRQYTIADDILKVSCDEGGHLTLTQSTTADDIKEFTKGDIISCSKSFCSENRVAFPATVKILDAKLEDYKDFIASQL